ncbi:MAG: hypothetical protein QNL62_23790 [Gammaproteobacteria bacterium]|nr:hypothetical protein [Gammaproteobacteria bacterium]
MTIQTAIGLGKSLFMTFVLLLFIYPQQVLSGVIMNVLEQDKVIQVSIQTEDKKTIKQTVSEEKNAPIDTQNSKDFTLLDYAGFAKNTLNSISIRILSSVTFVFLALFYFIRRQEHKISLSVHKNTVMIPPLSGFIPIRFTINNNQEPEMNNLHQAKNTMTLLENAFENNGSFSETGFIKEKEEYIQDNEKTDKDTLSSDFLNSVEEIKYINEVTRFSKIDAFLKMTQSDDESSVGNISIEGLLENELTNIQYDEKVDVFIEEFDRLISSLSQQTTILDKEPDELENLIQFKLSIHLIKVLSDMMQANYLTQFSQTIIEFLEDIVDGNAKMTTDILRRLHNVVSFCNQYISFLKNGNPLKAQM